MASRASKASRGPRVAQNFAMAGSFTSAGQIRSQINTVLEAILVRNGKEVVEEIRTRLSRQWSPNPDPGRQFPLARSNRLNRSIGYVLYKQDNALVLASGIMVKVPLKKRQLPPTIWGIFQEYGKTVQTKNPAKPFFYIPATGSPALLPSGEVDESWLPGKSLREKLKAVGRSLGARAYYFPVPESKNAQKRNIFIAAMNFSGGKGSYVMPPTLLATGVRKFTIPARPFLRPSWRNMFNEKGTGRLNRDLNASTEEISDMLMSGLRTKSLADLERSTNTVSIRIVL